MFDFKLYIVKIHIFVGNKKQSKRQYCMYYLDADSYFSAISTISFREKVFPLLLLEFRRKRHAKSLKRLPKCSNRAGFLKNPTQKPDTEPKKAPKYKKTGQFPKESHPKT